VFSSHYNDLRNFRFTLSIYHIIRGIDSEYGTKTAFCVLIYIGTHMSLTICYKGEDIPVFIDSQITVIENEFEHPIVLNETGYRIFLEDFFREHPTENIIPLDRKIPMFRYVPMGDCTMEDFHEVYQRHLTVMANICKYWDDTHLEQFLLSHAHGVLRGSLKNEKIGEYQAQKVWRNIDAYIESAMVNRDTILLKPNHWSSTLVNPFAKNDNPSLSPQVAMNSFTGSRRKESNIDKVREVLADYNLNQGKLTREVLARISGVSVRSLVTYIKDNDNLREMYEAIKEASAPKASK
jgi:hypothetical protein